MGEYCSTYFYATEQMEDAAEDASGEDFIIPHTSLRGFSFPFMLVNIPVQYIIFLAVPDVIFQTVPDTLSILTVFLFFFFPFWFYLLLRTRALNMLSIHQRNNSCSELNMNPGDWQSFLLQQVYTKQK